MNFFPWKEHLVMVKWHNNLYFKFSNVHSIEKSFPIHKKKKNKKKQKKKKIEKSFHILVSCYNVKPILLLAEKMENNVMVDHNIKSQSAA